MTATTDRSEFTDAVRAQAFTTEEGRRIVHCFMGFIGADWDEEFVLSEIRAAVEVRWIDNSLFDHDLVLLSSDGKIMRFGVTRPARETV